MNFGNDGLMKWNIVSLVFLALWLSACTQRVSKGGNSGTEGTCYYLDAIGGDDTRSGLSEGEAWRSIGRINRVSLRPGDKVLFKRGTVFSGELEIVGEGTEEERILIGAYGEAEAKPRIEGYTTSLYAVHIFNSAYVTLQDLEIVNTGPDPLPYRTGLKIESMNHGVSRNILVDNVTVRDVNGSLVKEQGGGCGIYIVNGGEEVPSVFDSLVIENCHIQRCTRNAIIWSAYYDRNNWHPNTNTVVRGNLIEGVPGDGIVPIGCEGTLIEYNIMRDCPDVLPATEAAAGIWPWSCDNTIIRFNEVSDHKAPWDAQGFDCDYNCNNTLIEYNYSHDNYGGLVLICNSGAETSYSIGNLNSVVRYNISIGDGIRPKETRAGMFSPSIHVAGPAKHTLVEHNIIHANAKPAANVDRTMITSDSWDGFADDTSFKQNIFYAAEASKFSMTSSTNNLFDGNWYIGTYQQLPADEKAHTVSETYQKEVLDVDRNGYEGLHKLMNNRMVCGVKGYFVDKEAIESFFDRCR